MFNLTEEFPLISPKHALRVLVAAAVLVTLGISGYLYFNLQPSGANGEVLLVTAYPFHAEKKPPTLLQRATSAVPIPRQTIVLTEIRMWNESDKPVAISQARAVMSQQNEEWWSDPISLDDFSRIFVNYPELHPLRVTPIAWNTIIPPGGSVHGMLIFHYPFSIQEWNKRKSFAVKFKFPTGKTLALDYAGVSNPVPSTEASSAASDSSQPMAR